VRWPTLRRAADRSVASDLAGEQEPDQQSVGAERRFSWARAINYGLLPSLALLLAPAAGYLKWQDESASVSQSASADAVRAATDGTIALLSYKPDTVEKDLAVAQSRMTGTFLSAYTSLTHDVVIPGAKQKQVSAVATVPAAASVRATPNHAVVLLCVNQSVIVGQDAPTTTASSVRVSLDKIGGRWLISQFDPV
jgi:Mce-associated membrane protein